MFFHKKDSKKAADAESVPLSESVHSGGFDDLPSSDRKDFPAGEIWDLGAGKPYCMRRGGKRKTISYGNTTRFAAALEWVRQNGKVRIPVERSRVFRQGDPFMAAGRTYAGPVELRSACAGSLSDKGRNASMPNTFKPWYKDCYGRTVLYMEERFPCFDSYDYANEDRYYRWFFLCEKGKLTRVYMEDGKAEIYATEDVAYLEEECFGAMERQGFLGDDGST